MCSQPISMLLVCKLIPNSFRLKQSSSQLRSKREIPAQSVCRLLNKVSRTKLSHLPYLYKSTVLLDVAIWAPTVRIMNAIGTTKQLWRGRKGEQNKADLQQGPAELSCSWYLLLAAEMIPSQCKSRAGKLPSEHFFIWSYNTFLSEARGPILFLF